MLTFWYAASNVFTHMTSCQPFTNLHVPAPPRCVDTYQLKMCRTTQKKVSWKARTPKFPFFFLHQMDNRTTWFRFIQRIIPEAQKRSKGSRAWSYQFWFSLGVKEKVISCTETHVRSLGILASEWNFNLSSRKINKATTTKWQKEKEKGIAITR